MKNNITAILTVKLGGLKRGKSASAFNDQWIAFKKVGKVRIVIILSLQISNYNFLNELVMRRLI